MAAASSAGAHIAKGARRRRYLLPAASIASIALIWAFFLPFTLTPAELLWALPLQLPYWIFLFAASKRWVARLAVLWGVLGSVPMIWVPVFAISETPPTDWLLLFALIQCVLVVAAVRLRPTPPRTAMIVVFVAATLVVASLARPTFVHSARERYEQNAISQLRTIQNAQREYAAGPGHGSYAGSLEILASSGFLVLYSLPGYRLEFVPGRRDASGALRAYTAAARPVRYRIRTRQSFFADETGAIHATPKNRPATVADPAL